MNHRTVLLIDDDQSFRSRLAKALERRAVRTVEAGSFAEAKLACEQCTPSHAVLDLKLGGPDGLQLLRALLEWVPGVRVVMLTGYGSIATAVDATRAGAVGYLTKPAEVEEILRALDAHVPAPGGDTAPGEEIPAVVPSLARAEWEHIQRVLLEFNGNISRAAAALGIPRRSLQRKLSKPPSFA